MQPDEHEHVIHELEALSAISNIGSMSLSMLRYSAYQLSLVSPFAYTTNYLAR